MAALLLLIRHRSLYSSIRCASTSSAPKIHRRYPPPPPHDFSGPCEYLGSWERPSDPREAQARLEHLRRGYARQVKQLRREYAYEMELLRQEKERRDEARREAARLANEQRKAAKAAAAETRAAERKAFQEEFRRTLVKERLEKLESWRSKEGLREKNKNENKELLRQQTSMWVAEKDLYSRISHAIVEITPL